MTPIYFRIRELRRAKDISQAQLAAKLGFKSSSTIALWETGHRNPPSTILPRLAAELGCTVDELYSRKPLIQSGAQKSSAIDGAKERR